MKKKINGYDNYYIYDNGDVENITTQKILQGSISLDGYKYYRLSKDNNKKMFFAHRLVAEYFIPNPNNLPVVNHIDGNKNNNDVSNLEWVTQSQNVKHAHLNNLINQAGKPIYYENDLLDEEWRSFKDFDNYLFSNKGRVRNIKTNRILKPSLTNGYYKVRLSKNGKVLDYMIHKIIYAIFNNLEYLTGRQFLIDHIDGNKINNDIKNLRKVTNQENALAAFYEQKTNKAAKAVGQYSLLGELIQTFPSAREASRILKLDSSTISKVCRGVNKTHGGFIFKYL